MKKTLYTKLFFLVVFWSIQIKTYAQITVNNTTYTPTQLVNGILVPTGSGTVISNVVFRGVYNNSNRYQVGYFSTTGNTLTQMGFTSGVVITTGNTSTIPLTLGTNPGNVAQMATAYTSGTPGELRQTGTPAPTVIQDLDVLAGAFNYFNGAILEFDFVPVDTNVKFRYIFGSEEYSDQSGSINYNCSSYNDKFGFLISGPGIAGGQGFSNNAKNIARLANGSEVSINSVNNGVVGSSASPQNASYCTAANGSWIQNTPTPEFLGFIDGTQLNGNTRILTASQSGLTPGQTYHIKLIITDVNDATYDSVVYLEAGSFSTTLACAAGPDQNLCGTTSTSLAATSPSTGTWSVVSGTGTFTNATSPTTSVSGLTVGTNVFRWTAADNSCSDEVTITVATPITPTFNSVAPICSGGTLFALPTTSNNGITGTWAPSLNNTTTTTYTFTPNAGQCANNTTLTITVTPNVTPTFNPVAAICSGGTLAALPTISNNGINGTWSPALNNTTTTTYTFTPNTGQCATTATLTITVNPNITPTFNSVTPICAGGSLAALPTTSTNGITGTWAPTLNNTTTTTYTFTPNSGQCATNTSLTITVNPNITPTFNSVAPICFGGSLSTLPTTSTNGITGTWAPALNNTATTTYTFTPNAGQCANNTSLTITVNPNVTPTFNSVAPICSGGSLSTLPTTSNNGITGTWSPALNNTATTTYTFTPTDGQCATTTTLTITVNPNVTPSFNSVAPICSGGSLSALPTTSNNGITGTWSPALNNTATTTYTFTPNAGQCATTTTLTITVNPTPVLTISCGTATPSSVTFNWNAIGDATSYSYSYSINGGPAVNGTVSNITTTLTVTGVGSGQNVSISITAVGSICTATASSNCVATNCSTPIVNPISNIVTCSNSTIPTITFTSPSSAATFTWTNNNTAIGLAASGIGNINSFVTANVSTTQVATINVTAIEGACTGPIMSFTITVNPIMTPTFSPVSAICSGGSLSALPTTSNNGITGNWAPVLNNLATTIYTFTPTAGQCATTTTLTITVNPNVTPTFNSVAPICSGGTLAALPTTSTNGITGTWSPALNNTTTTTYTFTPNAGQCATTTNLTITVNPNITPTFNSVAPICTGGSLAALPTTSTNGITGTWTPALNNTATTTYTFTPNTGQCATNTTLTITVNPNATPTFNTIAPICSGGTLAALPKTSTNGITGTWSPALNNTTTTTYTFTPNAGQCATNTTLTITVNPNTTPVFNTIAPICSGETLAALPTTSTNGISGTWSPALNNTATTNYIFTPNVGQCATGTNLTITIIPNTTPTFNTVATVCAGSVLNPLPTISNNGITGTWSPVINNTETTTYTFTPNSGQCATTTTLTITVNDLPDVAIVGGCNGSSFQLTANTDNNAITTFAWYNSNDLSTMIGNTATITLNQEGNYTVIVSRNTCQNEATYSTSSIYCGIPKGISPNGDGSNDNFDLSNLNVKNLQIFNRYGMEMYSKANYKNEWDGKTNSGQDLPDGTYYYIIQFNNQETKTGWVYKMSAY